MTHATPRPWLTAYERTLKKNRVHVLEEQLDEAKAAIKAVLYEFDRCTMFDANGSKFILLRDVLAKIEGSHAEATR